MEKYQKSHTYYKNQVQLKKSVIKSDKTYDKIYVVILKKHYKLFFKLKRK